MDTTKIKAAVIQDSPIFLNLEETIKKAESLIQKTVEQNVDLIAFPETWFPGYPLWLDYSPKASLWDYAPAKALFRLLFENSPEIPGPFLQRFQKIAKANKVDLVLGLNEREKGTLYNSMLFISSDGENYALRRKLVPTYTERLLWGRGDGSTLDVLKTPYGTVGGMVCWEHWMPLLRAAMHAKNETVHIAQWPFVKDLHQIASRQYAFEGQCFVLAAGGIITKQDCIEGVKSADPNNEGIQLLEDIPGDEKDLLLKGGSTIIGPDSSYLVDPVYGKAGIIVAELDISKIIEGKMAMDSDGHYSRPDIFNLNVNTKVQENVTYD